jgi:acyl-ACP thioesterase
MKEVNNLFELELTVPSYLTDNSSHLAPHSLLLLMQEVAWAHVEYHNIGWNYMMRFNLVWALTRLHLKIFRMPEWNEKIKICTWGKLSDQIVHFRDHEITDIHDNLLIAATSTWAILDFTTGRPQKFEQLPRYLYVNEKRHAIAENAPKIQPVDFSQKEKTFKAVLFSDLDMNQHVNNSKYLQFTIDSMNPDYVMNHRLKEIFVNYMRQAKIGDSYCVLSQEIAENNFIHDILNIHQKELARIETKWEKKEG